MANTFTAKQEEQIRRVLDQHLHVGTAHITLCDLTTRDHDEENGITWYVVRAEAPTGTLPDSNTVDYSTVKSFIINVGVLADRRRHVYTTLCTNQFYPG